jgi:hypothetical protein
MLSSMVRIFFFVIDIVIDLWLGGENVREELQQVARDVSDLAKDAKRS